MRRLLILLASVFLVMIAAPASATHYFVDPGYYWGPSRCPNGPHADCNLSVGVEGNWTNTQVARVQDAIAVWNAARSPAFPGALTGPTLTWGGENWSWNGCGLGPAITIGKDFQDVGPLGSTAYQGTTELYCSVGSLSYSAVYKAHITILQPSDQALDFDPVYWGNAVPEPDYRLGDFGVVVHELGHALLFPDHWDEGWCHGDIGQSGGGNCAGMPPVDDYCKDDVTGYPNHAFSGQFGTMCHDMYGKFGADGVFERYENYDATLAVNKDIYWYNAWYSGAPGT